MDFCGKLCPCTNSGYQTILPLFLWPGNEASTTTATEQTPVTYFSLLPVKLATFH